MKKQLKIAMFTGAFPSVSETFIQTQIKSLKELNHTVNVYCFDVDEKLLNSDQFNKEFSSVKELKWKKLMPKNIVERYVKAFNIFVKSIRQSSFKFQLLKSFNFFRYKKDSFNLYRFYKTYYRYYFIANKYDVVHIHFANNAVHLLPLLKRFTSKTLVTFHGYDAHKYSKLFYQELVSLPNLSITVNTNYTLNKVLQLGFSKKNISILPASLDTNFFKPKVKKVILEKFNILFVGRFVEFKAPLKAIKIIENLLKFNQNVNFWMVGSGQELKACSDYINEKKLNKYINLLGNQSQSQIKNLMEKTDVFIYSGITDKSGRCENQGLVIQEAQAMKLPVIVSDVGGINDGVIHGETGYVVASNDVNSFVEKLNYLMLNPKVRFKMGNAGREFVKNKYDTNILIQQLIAAYH